MLIEYPNFLFGIGDGGFDEYIVGEREAQYSYLKHVDIHKYPDLLVLERPLTPAQAFAELPEPVIVSDTGSSQAYAVSLVSGKYWFFDGADVTQLGDLNHDGFIQVEEHNGVVIIIDKDGNVSSFFDNDHDASINENYASIDGVLTLGCVPIVGLYDTIYIGAGNKIFFIDLTATVGNTIAQPNTTLVSNAIFNSTVPTALFPADWLITDMIAYGNEILVGLAAKNSGAIARWKPFSDQNFYSVDKVDGIINYFFNSYASDVVFACVGNDPAIYSYTGARLSRIKEIAHRQVLPNCKGTGVRDGLPVFAVEGTLYSFYQNKENYPWALVHSFTCTGGENAEIISIASIDYPTSGDQLLVSWRKGDEFGVDSIDYTDYAIGKVVTPVLKLEQEDENAVQPNEGYSMSYHYDPRHDDECDLSVHVYNHINNDIASIQYVDANYNTSRGSVWNDKLFSDDKYQKYEKDCSDAPESLQRTSETRRRHDEGTKKNVCQMLYWQEGTPCGSKDCNNIRLIQGEFDIFPQFDQGVMRSPIINKIQLR